LYLISKSKGTGFCTECRKIPSFSQFHVSTGSTLPSISEYRCLEDNEHLDVCSEEDEEKEEDIKPQ
jgi:hypothetical protein